MFVSQTTGVAAAERPQPTRTLSPEIELLLLGSRSAASTVDQRVHALLGGPIDWPRLTALANQHRVLPLLYATLQRSGAASVPVEVLAGLRDSYQTTVRQNLLRTAELVRILKLLEHHGVQAVPFKGPLLASQMYGDLALRQFSDLDVIVRQSDLALAQDLLAAQGYEQPNDQALSAAGEERTDCLLIHRRSGITIELQCAVFRWPFRFPDNFAAIWERLDEASLVGSRVHTFPAEELLLYLCVHGAKHLWQRLIWICDVAERLRARAVRLGGLRMLHLGLLLAHELLGAADTPLSAAARADRLAAALAAEVCADMYAAVPSEMIGVRTPLFYLRMRERLRDRLGLCVQLYPGAPRSLSAVRSYGLRSVRHLLGL